MSQNLRRIAAGSLVFLTLTGLFSNGMAQGTAFTYQGQLNSEGAPANGLYDFTFALFNTDSGDSQIGNTITNLGVGVTNGLFTTTLDFGPVFTGHADWLSIGVQTNGGTNFTALRPLQPLTPAPYAIYAPNAGTAANVTGPISAAQLPGAVLTNNDPNVSLNGSFAGNGFQLTNINPSALASNGFPVPISTNIYLSPGVYSVVIPAGVNSMVAKLWGSGGGTSEGGEQAGGGAFAQVKLNVTPNQSYVIVVGQAGNTGGLEQNGGLGGGNGANDASGGNGAEFQGGGGQASSIFQVSGSEYIMRALAGGGAGGGLNPGGAGLASGSASGYSTNATTTGETNLDLMGGDGGAGSGGIGAGGGGGYGGGSGGGIGGTLLAAIGGGSYGQITASGSRSTAANTNDPNYQAPLGNSGNSGMVVILFAANSGIALPGPLQALSFLGDGLLLTNLNSANLSGTILQTNLGTFGLYQPTIGDGQHNFSTATNYGYYAKFGNQVYFEAWLIWTNKGLATGSLAISLPFTSASLRPAFSFSFADGVTNAAQLVGACNTGAAIVNVEELSTAGGRPNFISTLNCAANGEIQITGTYRWQ